VNKKTKVQFEQYVRQIWEATKAAVLPKFHQRLRKVLRKLIREDERNFIEFVALMETTPEDLVNKKLQEAALEAQKQTPDEAAEPEDEPLYQCHYCGDMRPVTDMSGAKEGLMCYKCRHEMENRE